MIACLHIDGRIHEVYILSVQLLPQQLNSLPEPLEVDDLTLPEEADHIINIRIITEPQDVVIGYPCFLL